MTHTPPPETEPQPLLIRQPLPPPPDGRIDKKKLVGVFGVLGLALIVFFGLKLQSKYQRQQTVQPAPLPGIHQVSGTMPLDQGLKLPTSYEGIDRRPKQAAPPTPPTPVVEAAAPVPLPDPLPIMWGSPASPAPPERPPPPQPIQQRPAMPQKEPPKPWRMSEMSQTILKPPFEKPTRKVAEASDQEKTTAGLLHQAQWTKPQDPTRVLYRSQVIPGTLLHEVNSDIPGPVRLMVTRPVTDRFHQGHILVPQHSLILGEQDGKPQFGQTRIAVKIDELHFPDGTIVHLKGYMADRGGALGAGGKVNNHYVKIGVAALLSAALNIGARGAAGNTSGFRPTLEQEYARDVGESVNQTGQSIVNRQLGIAPTITLKAGDEITVQFGENVSFARPPTISK